MFIYADSVLFNSSKVWLFNWQCTDACIYCLNIFLDFKFTLFLEINRKSFLPIIITVTSSSWTCWSDKWYCGYPLEFTTFVPCTENRCRVFVAILRLRQVTLDYGVDDISVCRKNSSSIWVMKVGKSSHHNKLDAVRL